MYWKKTFRFLHHTLSFSSYNQGSTHAIHVHLWIDFIRSLSREVLKVVDNMQTSPVKKRMKVTLFCIIIQSFKVALLGDSL